MEFIATTLENLEDISQKEIKEQINVESSIIFPGVIKFKAEEQEAINLIHNTQSIIKVYLILDQFKFKDIDSIKEKIWKIDFSKIREPFVVRSEKKLNKSISSLDLEKQVGEIIHENFNKKVSLKEPITIVAILILEDVCIAAIDYTGEKLTRRDYRIKLNVHSINPIISYAMIKFSEWKPSEPLLDPFVNTGDIIIEAAIYSLKIPPNKDKQLQYEKIVSTTPNEIITNSNPELYGLDKNNFNIKKTLFNAAIISIQDKIKVEQGDVDWLDVKFEKEKIKRIITYPQYTSLMNPNENIKTIYKELFYQADYTLDKNGTITILHPIKEDILEYTKNSNFKLEKARNLIMNNKEFSISIFKKVYKEG